MPLPADPLAPLLTTRLEPPDERGELYASAACACGAAVDLALDARELPELPDDGALDPPVRAALLRRLATALAARGCEHAPHDVAVLAACALRPSRARLAEAFAVATDQSAADSLATLAEHARRTEWRADGVRVRRHDGELRGELAPAEAWEIFAARELIPLAWVGDARRVFEADGLTSEAHPPTLRAAIAFAADVPGVTQAEALAREVAHRLAPFGVPRADRVRWRLLDVAAWRPAREPGFVPPLRALLGPLAPGPSRVPWWDLPAYDAVDAARWRAQADAGAVADCELAPGTRGALPLAQLANPFEPALALWLLGYAIDAIEPGELVLAAPAP